MRVILVDDEVPTRTRLKQMLAAHPDVEVVGEAGTGPEAMEAVGRLRPDLVLLDIEMPGCSGIDVAACLPAPRPRIIFCTAYDQYAIDAFELNAVDYLLKPVSRARLADALDRVRGARRGGDGGVDRVARDGKSAGQARFLVRKGGQFVVVAEQRVLYFGTEGSLTRLVSADGEYWMDPSLNELEERLDPARYFRLSRAALVNLGAIAEVSPHPGGGGEVKLRNGSRLEVSRRRFRDLLAALAG